jgi:hypothetical protein
MYAEVSFDFQDVTDKEKVRILEALRPLQKEVITAYLTRWLLPHKRMEKSHIEYKSLILNDISCKLYGLPEYAILLGIVDILESESPFFPTIGEIYAKCKKHEIEWPFKTESAWIQEYFPQIENKADLKAAGALIEHSATCDQKNKTGHSRGFCGRLNSI